jgi:hemerythrin-like domain-containing protein
MAGQDTSSGILMHEHEAIKGVLDLQDDALSALEHNIAIDAGIFADFYLFFSLFVGKCHHGKEEQLLFPELRQAAELVPAIDALVAEHVHGGALVQDYYAAQQSYTTGGLRNAPALIVAGRAYARFLRNHIQVEDERVLRRAADVVGQAEDGALVASFDRFEDEVMGKGTHEKLHAMIDTLGPRLSASLCRA